MTFQQSTRFQGLHSRVALVTDKNSIFDLPFLKKKNAQQGKKFYSSTRKVLLPDEFKMFAQQNQPFNFNTSVCGLKQNCKLPMSPSFVVSFSR